MENAGYATLKLDMSKAYDCVEWLFVGNMMERLGSNARWISLIMRCVQSVSFYFLVNWEVIGSLCLVEV